MLSFSVIIVSWNALNHLQTFLPSVAGTDYPEFEILLADNASTDGSAEWVREHYPAVRIVSLDKNYGYCGGNNRAAQHANGDVLVFLNNDVKVEPDWLNHLADCLDSNPQVAAYQPKMLSYREPDRFEYAGAAGGYLDKYGYPFCRGRIFDTLEEDRGQYDREADLMWASGAALAIWKEPFKMIGGFDEDFEFHMEEIDLCWQLWNRGYRVSFCPESVVYHLGGGSLSMDSPRKVYYNYRNNLIMLLKNYATPSLWLRLPVRLALDVASALQMLFTGQWKNFTAVIKAHLRFILAIPKTLKKRKLLQQNRKSRYNPSVMQPISIVWNYFVKGVRRFQELSLKGNGAGPG